MHTQNAGNSLSVDHMSNNNELILQSGRHKQKEGRSGMIYGTIMYGMVFLKTQTLATMIIDEMSNVEDTVCISAGRKQEKR